jgi:hypothetical protein
MPMPAMPSRSLPQALGADGAPAPLPPLPDENVTPSSLPGTSEPCASPQGNHRKAPVATATALDTASTRTGYAATPAGQWPAIPAAPSSSPAAAAAAPAPLPAPPPAPAPATVRPYLVRFPVTAGGMNIEVELRMESPWPKAGKAPTAAAPK